MSSLPPTVIATSPSPRSGAAPDPAFSRPIEWSDAYIIGIPLIDKQHKRLFQLFEEFRLAYIRQKSQQVALKTLNGLLSYCAEHFESEEMVMRAVNYPNLDAHCRVHRAFVEHSYDLYSQLKAETLEPKELLRLMMDWLLDHVVGTDAKIAIYCRERNVPVGAVHTLSDVFQAVGDRRKWWFSEPYYVIGLLLCLIPSLGLLLFVGLWEDPNLARVIATCASAALVLTCDIGLIAFIEARSQDDMRYYQISQSKQLAEKLVAGEIASRIAVMDLDDVDELFGDGDGEGYLLQSMKDIVDHLRSYLPYIPNTLLMMIRREESEDLAMEECYLNESVATSSNNKHLQQAANAYSAEHRRSTFLSSSISSPRSVRSLVEPIPGFPGVDDYTTVLHGSKHRRHGSLGIAGTGQESKASAMDSTVHGASEKSKLVVDDVTRKLGATSTTSLLPLSGAAGVHPVLDPEYRDSSENLVNSSGGTTPKFKNRTSLAKYATTPKASAAATKGAPPTAGSIVSGMSISSSSKVSSFRRNSRVGDATLARTTLMQELWLQKKYVTLMVCAIQGFNELLFSLSGDEILELHSLYITLLEEVCKATKGVFGQMGGDRVTLSWNTANSVGNHSEQACTAAIRIKEGFSRMTHQAYKVAIAISTSRLLVGNVGCRTRLSFSVLGSYPSFLDGMCDLNTYLQTQILVSSHTWRDVKDLFIGKVIAPIDTVKPETNLKSYLSGAAERSLSFANLTPRSPSSPTTPVSGRSSSSHRIPAVRTGLTRHNSTGSSPVVLVPSAPPPLPPIPLSSSTRIFVIELHSPINHGVDEWMYAIQGARAKDPFADYNDVIYKLFGSSTTSLSPTVTSSPGNSSLVNICADMNLLSTRQELKAKLRDYAIMPSIHLSAHALMVLKLFEHVDEHCLLMSPQHVSNFWANAAWRCGWVFGCATYTPLHSAPAAGGDVFSVP